MHFHSYLQSENISLNVGSNELVTFLNEYKHLLLFLLFVLIIILSLLNHVLIQDTWVISNTYIYFSYFWMSISCCISLV